MRKVLLLVAFLITNTTALNSHCFGYQTETWWTDNFYECDESSLKILTKNDRRVDSVSGDHLYGKQNIDVDSYWLHDTTVYYFPSNLEEFYPDLIAISVVHTKLKEVHQEDFAPFPKLIKVYLDENELRYLEKGLFKFNPLLERFSAVENKIVHVDSSVFIDHTNLIYLHLNDNYCIDDEASDDRDEVLDLILEIQRDCHNLSVVNEESLSLSASCNLKLSRNVVILAIVVKHSMSYLI